MARHPSRSGQLPTARHLKTIPFRPDWLTALFLVLDPIPIPKHIVSFDF